MYIGWILFNIYTELLVDEIAKLDYQEHLVMFRNIVKKYIYQITHIYFIRINIDVSCISYTVNTLWPTDAYVRRKTNHHWFR